MNKFYEMDMNKFYQDCCVFNEVAGNDEKLTLADFKNQQGYNMEECLEISEGISKNDAKEIFDGVLDNFVTNFGHLQRLEKLGFDVGKGMAAVALNNLFKYLEEHEMQRLQATVAHYEKQGVSVYPNFNTKHSLWAIKRKSDDKIMKPLSFAQVELGQFIPQNILTNGLEV